ncbi:MAG TPA: M48 family metallopeptidase [Aggregatilineales bacterium]|nr:M48 family metallopeptidase [Aggregatilineales bacterium]
MANQENTPKGERVRFEGLDSLAFQHPLDRETTRNLKRLVGFDLVASKLMEFQYERLFYVYNIASAVRVGPKQFPKLHEMMLESCAVLDMPEPELYVFQYPIVNAFTFGHTRPYIMLYTALLELMTEEETMAIIAHELGHIKCGHVLYLEIARWLKDLTTSIGEATLGIGRPIAMALYAAMLNWQRRAELSADRASLLVMQDARPVITTLTKLAGGTQRLAEQLDPDEFLKQARIYNEEMNNNLIDAFYKFIASSDLYRTHPFAVERVKEIDLWANGSEYADILAGNYARGPRRVQIKVNAEA